MKPTGKFPVGVAELEYVARGLVLTPETELKQLDPAKHVVGRLFYPCDPQQRAGSGPVERSMPWLPGWAYATGYIKFLFFLAKGAKVAVLRQILRVGVYAMGRTLIQPFHKGAALATTGRPFPVVLFSHGLAGTRNTYSLFCAELASRGYVVLALEHSCGTASTCHLAGSGGYRFYAGLGKEEVKWAKQRFRSAEVRTAARLLRCLASGQDIDGNFSLSHIHNPAAMLKGALDTRRFALAGHSFGGASIGDLCASDPSFVCGVALDPWWFGMVPESPALEQWRTRSPLLVLGSHDWNTPREGEDLKCGGKLQAALLHAATPRRVDSKELGGGAMLLVFENTTHDSYNDVLALFSTRLGWFLRRMNFKMRLDPVKGITTINQAAAMFLETHMPAPATVGAEQPATAPASTVGMPQVDSDWSLVGGGSDDGAEPEIPSEATRTRSAQSAAQSPGTAPQTAPVDPVEGAEAAAMSGGGASHPHTASDAARLGDAQQTLSDARHHSGRPAEQPSQAEEAAKVPIFREEEPIYRRAFGDMIHILELAA